MTESEPEIAQVVGTVDGYVDVGCDLGDCRIRDGGGPTAYRLVHDYGYDEYHRVIAHQDEQHQHKRGLTKYQARQDPSR